jgi:predicted HNH restriction endonuclease
MPPPTTPPDPRDTTPIATADEFRDALLQVRNRVGISPTDLRVFRAFCAAPDHTLTAPKLAQAAGVSGWQEANLRFGTLSRSIGEALHFTPSKRSNGSLRWWMAAAHGAGADEEDTDYFQWVLRPELVEALRSMRWV